jgi:predicted RNA-binding protein with RPS1 domain
MMIDENQTPVGDENAQQPGENAGVASDAQTPAFEPTDETPAATDAVAPETAAVEDQVEPDPSHAEEQPAAEATPVAEKPQAAEEVVPNGRSSEPADDDMSLFEAAMSAMESGESSDTFEGGFKKLHKGERVEATVIQVDRDRLFVDLGTKSEGIVPLGELSEGAIESAHDHFKVGDKINVVVIRPEGAEGNPIVSKKRADFEEAWDRIEDAHREGQTITAQVVDRVKGGLVVDVGVRGFVPATHVGNGKLRNIEKYVGQPLPMKVIEIDRDRKKVVLSNRQAEDERRSQAKDDIFEKVQPGETLEGTVRRLTDYGAFVDLGGVDGLLHISEMSWMRINHPKEMFKEGQKIKVMVLRLDPGAGKISLGHRQVLPDPWNLIRDNYKIGQRLTITIGRIVQSGAFVKLPEGAEAFLPVSEMSFRRIKRPEDVIAEAQELEAQVIDLRPDERRMVLSLRATGAAPEAARGGEYAPSEYDDSRDKRAGGPVGKGAKKKKGRRGREEEEFEDVGRRGFATGGATIGERLGMLKGFLTRDEDEEAEAEPTEATEATEATETAETEAE